MTEKYERVLITSIYDKKETGFSKIPISTEKDYHKHLERNQKVMCDFVGLKEFQVKPYFDLDPKGEDFNYGIFDEFKSDLLKKCPNGIINISGRDAREEIWRGKTTIKHSRRYYIEGYRISYWNIPIFFKDLFEKYADIIDVSVYKIHQRLYAPLTKFKRDLEVPELKILKGSLFGCCASYIKEDYEDLDLKIKVFEPEPKKEEPKIKYEKIIKDDNEDNIYKDKTIDFIKDLINHFSINRAKIYSDWSNVCFGIIGACKKSKISKRNCVELIHLFSAMNTDSYDENSVDDWIDNNYKRQMDREDNQYGYNYLIHICLKEDSPDYYDDTFNKTYNNKKIEFEKEVIKINDCASYIQLNHNRDIHKPESFYVKDKKDLIHYYNDNEKFIYTNITKDKKGNINKEKISIVDIKSEWWKDCSKRKVDRLIFQPFKLDELLNKRYFNIFQGFRVQLLPINKDYVRIQRILNHIKNVICNKDEYSYNWFLKYLSAILKGIKTNVMIMIKGLEGCGKNIILNAIAFALIGEEYAVATASPEKQLFGNFNSLLQNRVLTIINEGQYGLRNCMDVIKDIITEDRVNIEKKGIDPTSLKNYNNFIGDTNNFNILNITPTDRRFVFFNCNNEYVGNSDYFTPLCDDLKDEKALSALYHYLIDEIDCPNDYDFQLTRPKTSIYKKLQQINLPNPITYLTTIKNNKEIMIYRKYGGTTYTTIKCADLYEKYKCWCAKFKYETFTYQQFETKITEDSKYGISKCIDRKNFKVFKIDKDMFEPIIDKLNTLEELQQLPEDDEFIHSDDE